MARLRAALTFLFVAMARAHAAEITVPADGSAQFTGQGTVVTVFNAGAQAAEVTLKCVVTPPTAIETVTIAPGAGIQLVADTKSGCALTVRGGPISVQY
jgi:hypothetical protein